MPGERVQRVESAGAAEILAGARRGTPMVVTGLARRWPATSKWTPARLRAAYADTPVFVRGSRAGLRDIGHVPLGAYVEWLLDGRFREPGAPRGAALLDPFGADHPVKPYVAYDAALPQTGLRADFDLESLRPPGYAFRTVRFWLGPEGAATPLHYDSWGYNLFFQACGRKRFLLFGPEQTSRLYPSDVFEFNTVYSRVDLRRPDLARFPRWREARPIELVLGPGDLLVLPRRWWHDVEALDVSISVNAWVVRPRDRLTASWLANRARKLLHEAGLYARGRCTCHLTPGRPDVGRMLGWD